MNQCSLIQRTHFFFPGEEPSKVFRQQPCLPMYAFLNEIKSSIKVVTFFGGNCLFYVVGSDFPI